MVSHAHPDHFMGLDVITERFPKARVVSTQNVVADIRADGPSMLSMLQGKLGPEALSQPALIVEGIKVDVLEFGECESKHIAAVYLPGSKSLLSADLVYNQAHLYLQERHLESWLARLDELEAFAKDRITTIHPGHGEAAGLELIAQTRAYLQDFAEAVKTGDAIAAEQRLLAKIPASSHKAVSERVQHTGLLPSRTPVNRERQVRASSTPTELHRRTIARPFTSRPS